MYNENIDKDDFTDSHTFENSFSSNIRHFRQNNLLALESVAIANRKKANEQRNSFSNLNLTFLL